MAVPTHMTSMACKIVTRDKLQVIARTLGIKLQDALDLAIAVLAAKSEKFENLHAEMLKAREEMIKEFLK